MASCLTVLGMPETRGLARKADSFPLLTPSVVQINQTGQLVNPDWLLVRG